MIGAVVRKELAALWVSPIPYVVGALFHVALGLLYVDTLRARSEAVFQPLVPIAGFLLLATTPALAMRTFAEEARLGTLDLLLAIPARAATLVVGKWVAAFGSMVVIAAPAAFHAVLLQWWGEPDAGPMITGAIGLVLLAAAATAVGVLASSLTSSQPVAALGAFFVLLLGWLVRPTTSSLALRTLSARLSISERIRTFAAGGVDLADLGFFAAVTVLALVAATAAVDARRLR